MEGSTIIDRLRRLFAADLRSLALVRILVGLGLLYDIVHRMTDLEAHYTDQGVLPTEFAVQFVEHHGWFSLHTLSGSLWFQLLLSGIFLVAAVCLTLGAWTRIATVVCWVLCVSVQNRFFFADYPGDYLLTMLLLWGLVLPWHRYWSLDARRGAVPRSSSPRYTGLIIHGYFFQFCIFISKTGISKIAAGGQWDSGEALFYTLHSVRYTSRNLDWSLDVLPLLEAISYAVPYIELVFPLVFFLPWKNEIVRTIGVICIGLLFTSFGIGLNLHLLPYFAAVAFIGFLPPWFWETAVPWALTRLRVDRPSWTEASDPEVLVGARELVADSRVRRGLQVLAGFLIFMVATHYYYKIGNFGYFSEKRPTPAVVDKPLEFLKMKNIFRMFSDPSVFIQADGWDVAPGTLVNGDEVNVFTGEPLDFARPPQLLPAIRGFRWRQYLTLINWYPRWNPNNISGYASVDTETIRRLMLRYLCRDWNQRHEAEERLVSINLAVVLSPIRYGQPRGSHEVIELFAEDLTCEDLDRGPL